MVQNALGAMHTKPGQEWSAAQAIQSILPQVQTLVVVARPKSLPIIDTYLKKAGVECTCLHYLAHAYWHTMPLLAGLSYGSLQSSCKSDWYVGFRDNLRYHPQYVEAMTTFAGKFEGREVVSTRAFNYLPTDTGRPPTLEEVVTLKSEGVTADLLDLSGAAWRPRNLTPSTYCRSPIAEVESTLVSLQCLRDGVLLRKVPTDVTMSVASVRLGVDLDDEFQIGPESTVRQVFRTRLLQIAEEQGLFNENRHS